LRPEGPFVDEDEREGGVDVEDDGAQVVNEEPMTLWGSALLSSSVIRQTKRS